ncbi:MAG: dTDP-4-dehydrorhamnose 3,5-epimerase [Elusimicrobiota bacterium]|nr:dTDP-4-dehydrorhamnose 3,5-epimerase [Endomicrobiia bacterium]MDW8166394.1 dTDP-4-dehydrorhamnose 3,5-epimerase [Elusimicrobiota bacterium]
MNYSFKKLEIPDVVLINTKIFYDERGFFVEKFKFSEFKKYGLEIDIVQVNYAKSKKNVLRGLHYQLNPKAQGKLVYCIKGKIFDVAVDLRKGSPWYGKYVGVELSEGSNVCLWVPRGFAHGYVSLEDDTLVMYLTDEEYSPEYERGILWNDEFLLINWPVKEPIVSKKDSSLPLFKDAENNFLY